MPSISDKQEASKEDFSEDIENIMRNFDFGKVHKAMRFLNWQWARKDGGMRVPNLEEIQEWARTLLSRVASEKDGNWSCSGGFFAEKTLGEYGPQLRLTFELCSWNGEDE